MYNLIQIYQFDFNAAVLGKFDYKMLMYNEDIPYGEKEQEIVKQFRKASSCLGNVSGDSLYDEDSQYWLQIKKLRKDTLQNGSVQYVTDVLIRGLFGEANTKRKAAFWACFGDTVYENLSQKVPVNTKLCANCGKRFRISGYSKYCPDCSGLEKPQEIRIATCVKCGETFATRDAYSGGVCPACKMALDAAEMDLPTGKTCRTCVDCGKTFITSTRGRHAIRCNECQSKRNRENVVQWKKNHKSKV